jgi:hypothetical protein
MLKNPENSLPINNYKNCRCLRQNGLLLTPHEYIKVGSGFNIDYETPLLLSCLPQSRHIKHQEALLNLAQTVYKDCQIPRDLYFQSWLKILESKKINNGLTFIHYGLTFLERGNWGSQEPQPIIRFNSPLETLSEILFPQHIIRSSTKQINFSSPKQP